MPKRVHTVLSRLLEPLPRQTIRDDAGTVSAVNTELDQSPGTVSEDPYGEGWLVDIDMSDASEFGKLLDATAYMELTRAG